MELRKSRSRNFINAFVMQRSVMAPRVHFHIHSNAAQLSGVSVMVLTLFYSLGVPKESLGDELLTLSVVLFVCATIMSYIAIRHERAVLVERIADWLFLGGLVALLFVSLFLSFVIF